MSKVPRSVSRYFASLGRRKTPAKVAAARANMARINAKKAVPPEKMEEAYQDVKAGKATRTKAGALLGCRYARFKAYCDRRDAGETMEQIKEST